LMRNSTGNTLPEAAGEMGKKRTVALSIVGVVVIAIPAGLFAWNKLNPLKPVQVVDRLCDYVVSEQKMKCVTVLATEAYMKPGSIVEYKDNSDGSPGRVPLPTADLLGETCAVPGTAALKSGVSSQAAISMPQLVYETNSGLKEGADIEVPKFKEFQFKAGPQWSDVSKVELVNDKAWAINLDELVAARAYQNCHIRKSCTDYIAARRYSVVQTIIVADGLSYKVYNRKGELVSLDAGVRSGQFSASVGGSTDLKSSTGTTIKATEPRVVGVRLLPSEVFTQTQSCDKDVAFDPPSGFSRVLLEGSGGEGNIGSPVTRESPIGTRVQLTKVGNELEAQSKAVGEAIVTSSAPGELQLAYNLRAEGGVSSKGGLWTDLLRPNQRTAAKATVQINVSMPILVRSEDTSRLNFSAKGMPPNTRIELLDWNKQRMKVIRTKESEENASFDSEGFLVSVHDNWMGDFRIEGIGRYELNAFSALSVETELELAAKAGESSISTIPPSANLPPSPNDIGWIYLGMTDAKKTKWLESLAYGSYQFQNSKQVAVNEPVDISSLKGKTLTTIDTMFLRRDGIPVRHPGQAQIKSILRPGTELKITDVDGVETGGDRAAVWARVQVISSPRK
jgi:hypothetical protein